MEGDEETKSTTVYGFNQMLPNLRMINITDTIRVHKKK